MELRLAEPCYLVQLGDDIKSQKWMITEDLEFDLNKAVRPAATSSRTDILLPPIKTR